MCRFVSSSPNESKDGLMRLLADSEVLVGTSVTLDPTICGLLKFAPKLKLIQCLGAGIENIPLDSVRESGVTLADASGSNSVPVAEHAFALILAIAKQVVEKDREMKNGRWKRTPTAELQGRTHVILGLGAIGTELAKRSQAFGMIVIGVKKHPSRGKVMPGCEVRGIEDLHRVLPLADFLTVAMPLTPETRGMIGRKELALMKKTASIVIVSRAAIVEEKALYEALSTHQISHGAIDPWYSMPPNPSAPSKYSIEKLDNVIATPHIAGITTETVDRVFSLVGRNIDLLSSGGELENVVDPTLGY